MVCLLRPLRNYVQLRRRPDGVRGGLERQVATTRKTAIERKAADFKRNQRLFASMRIGLLHTHPLHTHSPKLQLDFLR